MKPTFTLPVLLSMLSLPFQVSAQNVTVPTTCEPPYLSGTDTVLYTVPYTYDQVLSIIGSYKNLTWSGNPDDTVTLNGTDNTVGTARSYSLQGLPLIETILTYDSPPGGPYYENHNVALLTVPRPASAGGNFSVYFPLDATTVMSVCGGAATSFNLTAGFCSDNVTAAAAIIHAAHTFDVTTVGVFLGNETFTSCEALGASNGSATSSGGVPVSTFTGDAVKVEEGRGFFAAVAGLLAVGLLW